MGPGTMIGHHTQMPAGPAEVIRHRVAVLADDARGARSRNSHWHGRAERQDGDANFFATPAAIVADGLRHVRIQALRLNARDDRCRTRKALKELNFEEVAEREGFEPPIELPLCRISSAVHSTALPSLREIESTPEGARLVDTGRLMA